LRSSTTQGVRKKTDENRYRAQQKEIYRTQDQPPHDLAEAGEEKGYRIDDPTRRAATRCSSAVPIHINTHVTTHSNALAAGSDRRVTVGIMVPPAEKRNPQAVAPRAIEHTKSRSRSAVVPRPSRHLGVGQSRMTVVVR